MKPTLILGLGNPLLGDDGVGIRVIESLLQRGLPQGVEAVDGGTPGVGLLNLLEGRSRVVIVDAVDMGRRAGEVVRLAVGSGVHAGAVREDGCVERAKFVDVPDQFSLHESGVAEALALAHALDLALPELVVFGVQPSHVDWGAVLSPEVEAAVSWLVEAILKETGE